MKPVHDLICQLQRIEQEHKYAVEDEKLRRNAPPPRLRYPGLDLSWFDLTDSRTRSQLFIEIPIPPKISTEERFAHLVKKLVVDIKAAKIYLRLDIYPKLKARQERLPRFEAAIEQLHERAKEVNISSAYYLYQLFVKDKGKEYCWDCASRGIKQTRTALIYACMLFSRQSPKLARVLWKLSAKGRWWDTDGYYVRPYECRLENIDGSKRCDRCFTLLSYTLNSYGVEEEADYFLEREGELDKQGWWQLWVIFEGAQERNYPNHIADKLDLLISKYQLVSPQISVMEGNHERLK